MRTLLRCSLVVSLVLAAGWARAARPWPSPQIQNAFAKIQRQGKPYAAFYNYYICPHAIEEGGKVYCAYQDGNGRPIAMAYDPAAKRWSGPVRASDHGLGGDTHGNPSICADRRGRIHLFFGCHSRKMWHVRTVRPRDITKWQRMPHPTDRATYPEIMRMADGRLLLFYRAGGHVQPWSMRSSDDDGETWSPAERIIELRRAPKDPRAAAYCAFLPGATYRTVHCFFVHKDDNAALVPRRRHPWRPLKYPGLHEAVYRYNVYYVRRDAEGAWRGATGSKIDLPLTKADADKHALVHDTGHEFASHRRIAIGADDRPYLRFSVGVSDWTTGKVIVPHKAKFAAPAAGRWTVSESLPDDWPAAVRRRIMAPGPAAYGASFPNPWFIHFRAGPKADRTATYIWLGHAETGYASRKAGPAPSPAD